MLRDKHSELDWDPESLEEFNDMGIKKRLNVKEVVSN